MTPRDLVADVARVMQRAVFELNRKAPDYAPEGVCFVDLIQSCVDVDEPSPRKMLWFLYSKHATALRRYCATGTLSSETLDNRVTDSLNFVAMIGVWAAHENQILSSVYTHFVASACQCEVPVQFQRDARAARLCPRCDVLAWFHQHHPSLTDSTSAPS